MSSSCPRELAKMRKRAEKERKVARDRAEKDRQEKAKHFRKKYVSISKLVTAFEEELKRKPLNNQWRYEVRGAVKCPTWKKDYSGCKKQILTLVAKELKERLATGCFKVEMWISIWKGGTLNFDVRITLIKKNVPDVSSSYSSSEESSSTT